MNCSFEIHLVNALVNSAGSAIPQDAGRAPDEIQRTAKIRHAYFNFFSLPGVAAERLNYG